MDDVSEIKFDLITPVINEYQGRRQTPAKSVTDNSLRTGC